MSADHLSMGGGGYSAEKEIKQGYQISTVSHLNVLGKLVLEANDDISYG
jgi:hypothetical protein